MKESTAHQIVKIAIHCFKYSFGIGTAFLFAHYSTNIQNLTIYAFFYVMLAIMVNLLMLLTLLLTYILQPPSRGIIIKAIGLLLVNIPLASLYLWIVIEFPPFLFF